MAEERKQRLVVIGNGMAGARAVEELLLRGGGDRFEITMFGDEPHGNYNRILLSNVLNGAQAPGEIFLNPLTWYRENGITLHAGERVAAVDRAAKVVESEGGRRVPYDLLLFATGSRPFVPPLEGLPRAGGVRPGVFVFRTLDDCRRIAGYAAESARVAVIGGGLLGLEAARGLLEHGVEVHVVHQCGHLMNRQLDAPAAGLLRAMLERMGIRFHLGKSTAAVLGEDCVTGLQFDDGEELSCDMVVVACGIRPNVELAAAAGLPVERGIVVDDQMRTADPSVYAVGECAEHRGVVYGLVAPLWEQAQVLADHLSGHRLGAAYPGSKVAARLKVMGVELAAMGVTEPRDEQDEVVQFVEPKRGVYKKLIVRDDRLVGAILLGDAETAPLLLQAFDRGTPLPENRAAALFNLGGRPGTVPIEGMPDDATVCHCNAVSHGDIAECVAGGATGLPDVMRLTRACTGCGSCKTLVRELISRCLSRNGEGGAAPARRPELAGVSG